MEVLEKIRKSGILLDNEEITHLPDRFSGYFVTNKGRIISYKKWRGSIKPRVRKPQNNGNGYRFVAMTMDGNRVLKYVHRLVLLGFEGECPEGKEVRHLNNDRSDNRLCNIEYATHIKNISDRNRHGTHNKGERHNMVKLTKEEVIEIRDKYGTGQYTQEQLASEYDISKPNVSFIVNRRTWKHI